MLKRLTIYDFDDTLVKTKSTIGVANSVTKEKHALTPAEYAVYKPKSDDVFDFSEFDRIMDPEPIKKVMNGIRKIATKLSGFDVYILTARGAYKPVKDYLKSIGINPNQFHVVALGDGNPKKKADWIENMIDKYGYNDIYFIDDSIKNVRAVKKMLKTKSNIKYKVRHAQY